MIANGTRPISEKYVVCLLDSIFGIHFDVQQLVRECMQLLKSRRGGVS